MNIDIGDPDFQKEVFDLHLKFSNAKLLHDSYWLKKSDKNEWLNKLLNELRNRWKTTPKRNFCTIQEENLYTFTQCVSLIALLYFLAKVAMQNHFRIVNKQNLPNEDRLLNFTIPGTCDFDFKLSAVITTFKIVSIYFNDNLVQLTNESFPILKQVFEGQHPNLKMDQILKDVENFLNSLSTLEPHDVVETLSIEENHERDNKKHKKNCFFVSLFSGITISIALIVASYYISLYIITAAVMVLFVTIVIAYNFLRNKPKQNAYPVRPFISPLISPTSSPRKNRYELQIF